MAQTKLFISETIAVIATCNEPKRMFELCDPERCLCQIVDVRLLSFAENKFDLQRVLWKGIAEPYPDWLPQYVGPQVLYKGPCDRLPFRFTDLRNGIHQIAHETLRQWLSERN